MQLTVAEICELLGKELILNYADFNKTIFAKIITGIAPLDVATNSELSFLANPKYRHDLDTTHAAAILINQSQFEHVPPNTIPIVVANPYLAYAKISQYFAYQVATPSHKIHPTAIVPASAVIADNVTIGAQSVIGEGVIIGENTRIDSHVVIEDFANIGKNCFIKPHVFIGHHCVLGEEVTLHSHASVGNEGFGYAPKGTPDIAGWQKIHQLGNVVIGNHVRIGSQTCIDRGALGDTLIGNHVIVDNLVQIAHNVQIGDGTVIVACTGIAGSTKIGKRCVIAGAAGLAGHITICDDVTITGMAMVTKSITQPGSYSSGTPMMPTTLWRKAAVKFRQLANTANE